jgi:CRISPR/Cas system CSM-associated protein Csm2 small subunit
MPLDDNNVELNPSDSSEMDVRVDTENTVQLDDAGSSDATGATKEDTLSIVRDVVKEKAAALEAASPAETGDEAEQPPVDQTPKKDPDDENYSDVPFHKHPRFQHLLRKAKTYEQDAKRYQNVQGFLDTNGLSGQEAVDGLEIMALAKTQPAKAWERVKPWIQSLLQASGEVLPEDLAGRVQRGEINQDAAFELSRSRAQLQSFETAKTFEEQQRQRREAETQANSLYQTALDWENDRRAKDPNFEAKLVPIQEKLAYMQMREGKPATKEGVLDQLKRAYEAVILPSAAAQPQRTSQRVTQRAPMSGHASGNAQPKPQTTLDIIRAAKAKGN